MCVNGMMPQAFVFLLLLVNQQLSLQSIRLQVFKTICQNNQAYGITFKNDEMEEQSDPTKSLGFMYYPI
jgi:hypothetical protein